jgi:hypothetical protein
MPLRDTSRDKLIEKVLGEPALFPDVFKAWVPQVVAISPLIKFTADQLPTVDKVHKVGGTGEPAFQNSWVNYGAGFAAAGFWIDPWRTVHLQGMVASGTVGANIFALPGGYRPEEVQLFDVQTAGVLGRVDIQPGGAVVGVSVNNSWVSLSGITFRAF